MAKCLKDRIVYLPEDLKRLAILYDSRIDEAVPDRSLFFVSDVLGSIVSDTGLCRIFNLVWKATEFAEFVDRKQFPDIFNNLTGSDIERKMKIAKLMNLDFLLTGRVYSYSIRKKGRDVN